MRGNGHVVGTDLAGLDRHLARVRVAKRRAGPLTLLERVAGQRNCREHRDAQCPHQAVQAPGAALFGVPLRPLARDTRVEILLFEPAETGAARRLRSRVPRDGERATPQQAGNLAATVAPGAGRLADAAAHPQPVAVRIDPLAQPGPGGKQYLVSDLRAVGVDRYQALGDECVEHIRVVAVAHLIDGYAAAERHAVGDLDQAQEEPPRVVALVCPELAIGGFRGAGDRVFDAAAALVRGDGEHPAT